MSTLKVDTITKADGTGSLSVPAESGTVVTTASPSLGRRNLIINGGFDVWQRGTSFTGSGYSADRWILSTTESATAIAKTANRDNKNTLKITFGSTISANLDQRIEAFGNVGYNQQVTLSFWVRGSRATTADFCRIRNHTTSTTLETLTYGITTSWTKVNKTFSADNTWSKDDVARLYLFGADSSSPWVSGDWVEFSDVQLEVGSVATPFEHRSYGEELALCQRYYKQLGNKGSSYHRFGLGLSDFTNRGECLVHHAVELRANPTVSISANSDFSVSKGTGGYTCTGFGTDQNNVQSVRLFFNTASGISAGNVTEIKANNTASATIKFDAEL